MSVQATLTEISSTQRQLAVVIPQELLAEGVSKRSVEYRKKVRLPGFREGHVPQKVIASRFGKAIRQEALEALIEKSISEELKKLDLRPVDHGTLKEFKDDCESAITFNFAFEVDPEIEVKGYADLKITPEAVVVEEKEVEEELSTTRRRLADEVVVERPAADGDVVKGDYLQIIIGGEEQPLAENPNFRITLGMTQLKGLEAGLIGVQAGDEKSVDFKFPADYPNDEIAGKKATYRMKIGEVLEVRLPELDDEMAKKIGLESLEALRSEIEKQIREYKERLAREAAQHKAIDLLLKKNKFDVPEARIRYFVTQELKKEEVTDEEVAAGRERAVLEIRRYRILDWIANQEKIKPTQEEVDAHVELMAHSYGVPADVMKSHLRSSGRMAEVREDLRIDKTLNWLIGNRTEEEPKT